MGVLDKLKKKKAKDLPQPEDLKDAETETIDVAKERKKELPVFMKYDEAQVVVIMTLEKLREDIREQTDELIKIREALERI